MYNLQQKFWSIAWPLIVTNITVPLLGLADAAVLGHLENAAHLAAVALSANIFTFLFWSFGFLKMGTSGLIAQAVGRGDSQEQFAVALRAMLIAVCLAALLLSLQHPIIATALTLLNAPADLYPHAAVYAHIRIWSAPAVFIQYLLAGWLIGSQHTKIALLIAILVNVINIALDIVFVVFLEMRSDGVALGTLIAEYTGMALSLVAFTYYLRMHCEDLSPKKIFSFYLIKQIININMDLFIRTFALLFTFAFFYAQSAQLGTTIIAANAVLLTFLLIISNALDGFAQTTEALCGEAIGQKKPTKLHSVIKISTHWSLFTALMLSATFYLFGENIINLLTTIDPVKATATHYLPWIMAIPLIGMWSYLYDGIFIGLSLTKAMRNTMLISVLIIFLPTWWLTQSWGNHGLWFALVVFLIGRAVSQKLVLFGKRTL